jgi:dienelactone hydrolase
MKCHRPPRGRVYAAGWLGLVILVALVVLWRPATEHLRAASVLVRLTDPAATGIVVAYARQPFVERILAIPMTEGVARARLYLPPHVDSASGLVIVHGVHRLGIEEPRLRGFARAMASAGVAVLTPEVRELCDYRIEPASITVIGEAARALGAELGGARPIRVGVIGFSFAGGLAILAAANPHFAGDIAFVVAVGAHDDLGRVLRFFATNEIQRPDGTTESLAAHSYGPVVLMYSHAEDFFPAQDVAVARDVLRLWLWEEFDAARARSNELSEPSRGKMELVFSRSIGRLAPELLAEIARLTPEFAAVSPSAHANEVRVPVYLLHGAGDTVIPAVETLWLAHDLPRRVVVAELVSPAIEHVGLTGGPTTGEKLALVHFVSLVLEAADGERSEVKRRDATIQL